MAAGASCVEAGGCGLAAVCAFAPATHSNANSVPIEGAKPRYRVKAVIGVIPPPHAIADCRGTLDSAMAVMTEGHIQYRVLDRARGQRIADASRR